MRHQPARLLLLSALSLSLHLSSQAQQQHADQIIVAKSEHKMTLLAHGVPIKIYQVALGTGGLDPKQRAGDNKTPEGRYILDAKNANSRFHIAFHFIPQQRRQSPRQVAGRLPRRRHHDSRCREKVRISRIAPA